MKTISLQMHYSLTNLGNLIANVGLKPIDAVVIKDRRSPILDHYAIFLGYDENGYPVFIANYPNGGVRVVPHHETIRFLGFMEYSRKKTFHGNDWQRKQALQRAINRIGKAPYNLAFNNCEHFVNYVQTGKSYSQQTQIAAGSTALTGAMLATSSNPVAKAVGIGALIAGVLTAIVDAS